ncbi:carboxymuconolactone decarboxylase family protein [Paracoccus aurantiacus]|uniref:Carboxymuconolactone decarboxylase family protein n=1 Tax=Paracoccus aurantiacus TaxID=2599412 RepID=A0A5C6S7X8_9RHOB|nr:carboxymuconolactone decarboxylase family protein [Paracoccus aurantiacus]TXB70617.1 carboxymuconolactone decarboxylase family protein [Paracoccus aurantiacus]
MKNVRNAILASGLLLSSGMAGVADAQTQEPDAEAAQENEPSRAQQLFGEISPKMVELTDDVLYADIWERPELAKRDRSLVTISALIALNRPDQLRSHINVGLRNGLTEEEIVETITQMAFYAGWPAAVSALAIAKEEFQE